MTEQSGESPVPGTDWNAAADRFDEEPDHGLRDDEVRAAWDARLRQWLPTAPGELLDLGCGTGSLSLLAAGQGHRITAVDSAPRMVELARAKLTGHPAEVLVGDAASPPVGDRRFDVVLVRHVLWTLPEPERVLRHWRGLLRPGGRLVLVEGVWGETSPAGIPAAWLTSALRPRACPADLRGPTTPGTHSRRTPESPKYVQYEGDPGARREHAPDAAGYSTKIRRTGPGRPAAHREPRGPRGAVGKGGDRRAVRRGGAARRRGVTRRVPLPSRPLPGFSSP
ncbi:class I SAM-dependent methyltransferase [Streptomyces sp. NA04227]|nr:class I SAM-dependent methyltransferase [Streptomyces sp. NA04227]